MFPYGSTLFINFPNKNVQNITEIDMFLTFYANFSEKGCLYIAIYANFPKKENVWIV